MMVKNAKLHILVNSITEQRFSWFITGKSGSGHYIV